MTSLKQARQIEDVEAQLHILLASPPTSTSKSRPGQLDQAHCQDQKGSTSLVPQKQGSREALPGEQSVSAGAGGSSKETDNIRGKSPVSAKDDASSLQQPSCGKMSQERRRSSPGSAKSAKISSCPGVALYGNALERMRRTAERYVTSFVHHILGGRLMMIGLLIHLEKNPWRALSSGEGVQE